MNHAEIIIAAQVWLDRVQGVAVSTWNHTCMQPWGLENNHLFWRLLPGCLEQNIGISSRMYNQIKVEFLCSESLLSSYNHWSIQDIIITSMVQNTQNLRIFFLHHTGMKNCTLSRPMRTEKHGTEHLKI